MQHFCNKNILYFQIRQTKGYKMFLRILTLGSVFFFLGCGSSSSKNNSEFTNAQNAFIHERSGVLNSMNTHTKHTVMLHLESTQSHKNDTKGTGFDTYKVNIDTAEQREFCLKNDLAAGHRFSIANSQGAVILDISSGCAIASLEEGIYTYALYNGTISEDKSHSVFIYPSLKTMVSKNENASNKKQIRKLSKVQETTLVKHTTIDFNACEGCNLVGVDLSGLAFDSQFAGSDLSPRINEAYFEKLNTSKADFFETQNNDLDSYKVQPLALQGASLLGADLSYSVFRDANFDAVDFSDANLSSAVFMNCSFKGANFNNVDMTKTVFIDADFGKTSSILIPIVSQPSITRLFAQEKTSYGADITVAVNSHNRVVVVSNNAKHFNFAGTLPPMPEGITIVSPPTVSTNNFSQGYSVFVKGSDGFIYEYFNHGNVRGEKARRAQQWYKIGRGTEKCKSNPDSTFVNFGGSGSNALYNLIACHDQNGILHTWKRYFYNKPTSQTSSYYSDWLHETHNMPTTKSEISINRHGELIYIENNILTKYNYLHGTKESKNISASSRADLWMESDNGLLAYVGTDGNAYSAYVGNLPGVAHNLGAPHLGIIASPAVGSLNTSSEPLRVIVLSGDAKLYAKNLNGTGDWYLISGLAGRQNNTFAFTNSTLTKTYFQNVDLSNLDLSSNTYDKTFFTKVKFENSSFDNATLKEVVFDTSSYFNYVTFRNSTLNDVSFTNNEDEEYGDKNTNHKNMTHIDFTGSTINGLTLTNNILSNANFNTVSFSNKKITSNNNRFIGNLPVASFQNAKNIPVELLAQKEDVNDINASFLRSYDFSSASFSDSFYTLDFKGADMTGAMFAAVDSNSPSVDFKNIDASDSTWKDADLSYLTCNGCNFDNTVLNNTRLYQVHMNNSSFISSQWINTNASHAQFQNANLDALSITGTSTVEHTSFNHSTLFQSTLRGLTLEGASFDNAQLACSDMGNINFSNSSFSNALLNGNDFSSLTSGTIGGNANFNGANLSGVNFENVDFTNTTLTNAIFDFLQGEIFIDEDRSCSRYTKKPSTNSSTTCPNGNKPSVQCNL